jgi:hypothetical protein
MAHGLPMNGRPVSGGAIIGRLSRRDKKDD